MPHEIVGGFSIVDTSGYFIIGAIIACLVLAVGINVFISGRYAAIERPETRR